MKFVKNVFLLYGCLPPGNQMGSTLEISWKLWYKNVPSKLISTHCASLASLSFLLSLTTTSVYAIAKTLKLHTKCSLLACCCIIMSIVLWSFKLWVKKFDYFLWKNTWHGDKAFCNCHFAGTYLPNEECNDVGKHGNYIQNALPWLVVVLSWQLYCGVFTAGYILNS